jgi:hypothetical protein
LNAVNEARRFFTATNPPASAVGAGLRALVSISKAIGLGGKLPVSIDNISGGVSWALGQVGINSQSVFKAATTNRGVVAAGQAAAAAVFGKVSSGAFTTQDITTYQPPLENLNYLVLSMPSPAQQPPLHDSQVSPYAMDLFAFAPKYKFMFVVQFTFNDPYMQDANFQRQFAFVVKKSTRPSVKYNMEDVNYYNFRTKVTTKADFEEMSMTFHDDIKNTVAAFYTAYTRAMSPVLNYSKWNETLKIDQQGMTNNTNSGKIDIPGIVGSLPYSKSSSGSTGPLADGAGGEGNTATIIKHIKLFHVYDYGRKVNVYNFYNPRIESLDLDDVDMSIDSEGNSLEIKFNYEAAYTELNLNMQDLGLEELTTQGAYPLRFNGDVGRVPYIEGPQQISMDSAGSAGNIGHVNSVGDEFMHPDMGLVTSPNANVGFNPRDVNNVAPDFTPITTTPTQTQQIQSIAQRYGADVIITPITQ